MSTSEETHEINCPHCGARVELGEVVSSSIKTFLQFTWPCPKCKQLTLVILPWGNYSLIELVAIDKSIMLLEGLFWQIEHMLNSISKHLFIDGVPPTEEQRLAALREVVLDLPEVQNSGITPEEISAFVADLGLTNCPTDKKLFGKL